MSTPKVKFKIQLCALYQLRSCGWGFTFIVYKLKKKKLCSGKDSLTSKFVYGTTDVDKEPLFLEVFPLSKQVTGLFW